MKGIVISGIGSGVGKTAISTGLMSLLSKRYRVQPYKVGPDFIDPMYHTLATGRRSRNLDAHMIGTENCKVLVGNTSEGADLCIVEGVRGLFEGSSGITERSSTAEMAKALDFPVVLVLNARSMTRTAAAVINGLRGFDRDVKISGVILNNVSGSQHEDKLRDALGLHCDIEIIGCVPGRGEASIPQRHLGLATPNSSEQICASEALVADLETDRLMDIMESSETEFPKRALYVRRENNFKAAIPYDDAFCFYYRENLDCLESSGFDLEFFSPLKGDSLPEADMYYLGGGYPEVHGDTLSGNRDFMEGLKNAADEGKAILGECGGLMAMCSTLDDGDDEHPMSGIFEGRAVVSGRHGPKYVSAEATEPNPLFRGMSVRGHEFHYSDVLDSTEDYGFLLSEGTGIKDGNDGLVYRNSIGSYMHQHALSVSDWAGGIVKSVK